MYSAEIGDSSRYLYRAKRTTWISADNSRTGAARTEYLEPREYPGWPIPAEAQHQVGTVQLNQLCVTKVGARQDYAFFSTLPADAKGMLAYFGNFPGKGDPNYYLWKAGTELAGQTMPAAQKAAVFQALKLIPGAQLVGEAQDAAGRTGLAVGFVQSSAGVRHELIFDPDTFRFLGEREFVVDAAKAKAPVGSQLAATAVLSTTVSDTAPDAPAGDKAGTC
jgi:hypothetical protein